MFPARAGRCAPHLRARASGSTSFGCDRSLGLRWAMPVWIWGMASGEWIRRILGLFRPASATIPTHALAVVCIGARWHCAKNLASTLPPCMRQSANGVEHLAGRFPARVVNTASRSGAPAVRDHRCCRQSDPPSLRPVFHPPSAPGAVHSRRAAPRVSSVVALAHTEKIPSQPK